ncbi:MAG: HAMP domain-containing sensor histidine kinase [Pseudomonadota bacterium]
MLPSRWIKNLDAGRLRRILMLFFAALTAPTAVLIWQAYDQLKWESFHQHRIIADGLARSIDLSLNSMVRVEDSRSFADYSFVIVSGNASANYVQRSPLADFPTQESMPGLLGYFQIDSEGMFTTPILPATGTDVNRVGLSDAELQERRRHAERLRFVLADNRLVQSRIAVAALPSNSPVMGGQRTTATEPDSADDAAALADLGVAESAESNTTYSQQVFDELNRLPSTASESPIRSSGSPGPASRVRRERTADRVSDLQLDAELAQKSQSVEQEMDSRQSTARGLSRFAAGSKRVEQTVLAESLISENEVADVQDQALRILTFESEIDPFEFSLLDSGHIVLFRKVWRDNERFIQGALLDQQIFFDAVLEQAFLDSALSGMSNLIVANNDEVIRDVRGDALTRYVDSAKTLRGTLLYRHRLSAPLSSIELIFSVTRLPPGTGAQLLFWITLILAIVFSIVFLMMYRLGLGQINMARQQQDFVSAVSHELKTPLTSIRMYGEMLKEGWADESKRATYYEFIHEESERLSKLIENVLQLSRISRNEPHFDVQPVIVGALVSNIHSKIASQIERAGFDLRIERDPVADEATVLVDEDCFAQIVINLIDNAIKFSNSAEQKVVELTSRRVGERDIQIAIRDFGPGVEKDQMKKIFQLFYRSESELTRDTVGTGIGLAIVHQLTQSMGGSVDLVNAKPGAEFRVTIPIAEQLNAE